MMNAPDMQTTPPENDAGMPQTPAFAIVVRVYYEDTDAGGIVYYANYLRFMERARTEWLRAAGVHQDALAARAGIQFVVRRANLDFLAAARLDDQLSVSVRPVRFARTYVELEQAVTCAERTLCRAMVTVACVRRADLRPAPMPDDVAALMKRVPAPR